MIQDPLRTAEKAVSIHMQVIEGFTYVGPKPNTIPGVMPFDRDQDRRIVLVRLTDSSGLPIPLAIDELLHYRLQASEMERQLWVANVYVDDSGMNPTLKGFLQL